MTDDAAQRLLDAQEHQKTYVRIMKTTGEIAVPFFLALAVFFTNLVIRNPVWMALVGGVLTYLLAFFIVRTFFAH